VVKTAWVRSTLHSVLAASHCHDLVGGQAACTAPAKVLHQPPPDVLFMRPANPNGIADNVEFDLNSWP
jgi:hypothetical protein